MSVPVRTVRGMPEVPAWLVVIGAVIGYVLSFWRHRLAGRANKDTAATTAARTEIMGTYRFAAGLAADRHEAKRQLGIQTLARLAERPDVTQQDKILVLAALDVPLAPASAAWKTAHEAGSGVDSVVVDAHAPELERNEE